MGGTAIGCARTRSSLCRPFLLWPVGCREGQVFCLFVWLVGLLFLCVCFFFFGGWGEGEGGGPCALVCVFVSVCLFVSVSACCFVLFVFGEVVERLGDVYRKQVDMSLYLSLSLPGVTLSLCLCFT